MRFTLISSLALFAAGAIAQGSDANPFNIPNGGYQLTAGKASTITWKPTTSGTVTLTLREGANSDLSKGTVIAKSVDNSGSFTYTPDPSLVRNSDYTIEISSDSDPSATNFTPQFVIDSSNTVVSASSASGSASATASASSSASASSAASSSAAASSSSAASSASSASTASASKSSSKSGSATTTGSATATTGASSTTASAEKAPSNGAEARNVWNGGLAAVALGAALVL